MADRAIEIPLDGLGMDDKAMLELVNRMNANDDRKWVLVRRGGYQGAMNPLSGLAAAQYAQNQAMNTAMFQ